MKTDCNKEIGGYFELELPCGSSYHRDAAALNSGHNALRCLVRNRKIRKLRIPRYTCPVVPDALQREGCEFSFYEIGEDFLPVDDLPETDYILYTNYFGVCARQVEALAGRYPKLIVDNAQAFYMPFRGMAGFYSPRKFVGVPDGGYLYGTVPPEEKLERACSWDKMTPQLKRLDCGAGAGYPDFQRSERQLWEEPVLGMSHLTEKILNSIDYESIRAKRLKNFQYLQSALGTRNGLKLELTPLDVPMVYPFLSADSGLRDKLIANRIFVAKYWPGMEQWCQETAWELHLQQYLAPLPIDQRYDIADMQRILEVMNV